jgi:hypothetical protein
MPDEPQTNLPPRYRKDWRAANSLGRFIIEKLIENDQTKDDLKVALEVDRVRLRAIFDGSDPPTGQELADIARLLHVPLRDLLKHVIPEGQQEEIFDLLDTYQQLPDRERLAILDMLEDSRKRLPGEETRPSDLLSRRHRRRSATRGEDE